MTETITSLQNPHIKQAIKLHSSRGRQTQNRMIVFGMREFKRGLAAGIEFAEIYIFEPALAKPLEKFYASGAVRTARVCRVGPEVFGKLCYGDRVDGIVAVAPRPQRPLGALEVAAPGLVVVAQAIEKPGNLGAIIRTADACGVSAVLLADPLTDLFHPNAIRSSTGTVFGIPAATGTSQEIQTWLHNHRFRVLTARLENAGDFYQTDLTGNVALVVGNEAAGLDQQWESFPAVKLPMCGIADSLNVSVTASVMMYEANRQRTR